MVKWCLGLALIAGLAVGGFALAQSNTAAAPDNERIAQLIKQLGSSKYAEREKAKKDLEDIGAAARELLDKASRDSDLETSRRCQELIKKIDDKKAVEDLLTPKKVKLNFKDTPVMQAVDELQKQSGYPIIVDGDRVPLAKRTVTLQTGEITFWEALDRLCDAAHLAQVASNNGVIYQNAVDLPAILVQPIQPQPAPVPAPPPPPVGPDQPAVQPLPAPGAVPPAGGNAQPPNAPRPNKAVPPRGGLQANGGQAPQVEAMLAQVIDPAPAGNGQAGVGKALPPVAVDPPQLQGQAQAGQAGGAVQIQPAQVQILPAVGAPGQVQIQPLPVQPAIRKGGRPQPVRVYQPGTIVLRDGTPEKVPTSYHGALRVRLLPASRATEIAVQPTQKGESLFILEVSPEPRLQQFGVVGTPRLEKALDDLGQELALLMEPMPANQDGGQGNGVNGVIQVMPIFINNVNSQPRQVALRLKLGEKQAKALKELAGSLTVQALSASPEAVITVDNVLKAKGKQATGANGGMIEVTEIVKQANGTYRVKIRYENPPQLFPGNNGFAPAAGAVNGMAVQIQIANVQVGPNGAAMIDTGVGVNQSLPVLVDAKGKAWTLENSTLRGVTVNNGQVAQDITMVFRAGKDVGEPAQMVLHGHRMVTAPVPFRFEAVRLP